MRLRALLLPVLTAAALAVVPSTTAAAAAPDPAATGSHSVSTIEYDAGTTFVTDPSTLLTYPEQLEGAIYVPSGTGPFPVLLFLHGRHGTCSYVGIEFLGPRATCPDTGLTENVPSYRGYAYLGQNLASHGYLTVSVNANSINSLDWAGDAGAEERAQVIARTLDKLGEWNTGTGPGAVGNNLNGKVDLSRIGLMGHSRGGEGVDRFIEYNRTRTDGPRYTGLKAVFALAPTDFGNEAPHGVHWATLLPLCDGDVYDLQGARAYDRGRYTQANTAFTRAQYTVTGTNHNYFNTVWTLDDYSGTDPACDTRKAGNVRLNDAEQRDVGLAVMVSFFRRWVGGETAFDALVKGAEALPASACPGSATTCPDLVRTSYLAPTADRVLLAQPGSATVTQSGWSTFSTCTPTSSGTGCPTNPTRNIATQHTLAWTAAGATFQAAVPATNVSGLAALTFRTGVNYNDAKNTTVAQDLDVVVRDATGATATVQAAPFTRSLRKPAGGVDRELMLDGVWIPLSSFTGVDLTRVTAVQLKSRTASGSIQLAELAFQK